MNWSRTENEIMKGYLIKAYELVNSSSDDEITESQFKILLKKLCRATDDMTASEAQDYYLNSKFE